MNFTCPHCGSAQIVTDKARGGLSDYAYVGPFHEMPRDEEAVCLYLVGQVVRCANELCGHVTVAASLGSGRRGPNGATLIENSVFHSARLYPPPSGKPFPVGVPDAMLEDYREAWSILNLSPKSAATLARRVLQAMIRDFCQIRERTLYAEIEKLEEKLAADELPKGVEPETVAAMRVLKDKGNIGAHMTEVDGVIVGVDPGEAEQLLGLIEMLFADWYVARHKRRARLAAIEAMANPPKEED